MRICLISSEESPWGGLGQAARRTAELLATRHEVTLVHSHSFAGRHEIEPSYGVREVFAEIGPDLEAAVFACEDHRRSAAVLQAIERAYGPSGPEYLEVSDYRAHGLVPLQARRAGHPLLRDTLIAVNVCSTAELICLHDGTSNQPDMQLIAELEREQLRLADRLTWRGGDTLEVYRRYYRDVSLPEAVLIRPYLERPPEPPRPVPRDPGEPLRILFVGRLQRFKGATDLVEACLRLPGDDWQLTMIGADTETAPMGQSVRLTIEEMCGDDPRVRIEDPVPHDELQGRWAEHDLLAIASTFEVWGNVAVEAMRAGLPVLTTPVGGPAEIVEHGVTGWQASGLGAEAIGAELSRLLEDREELGRVRSSGAIYERFLRLTDPEEVLAGYEALFASAASRPAKRPATACEEPLATAIVPYHRSSAYVEEAVGSLLAQTHRALEVLIVNDGSFEEADEVLDRLGGEPRVSVVTQLNRGEPAARNLGARLARGEYLAMLDADNVLEPEFLATAIEMLRAEPQLGYVTCWLRMILADGSGQADPSLYAPLGNSVVDDDSFNWDGDALAVLPRRLFAERGYEYEPTSGMQSDWELYRQLRQDGVFGAVIPAPLARYRIHPGSLMRSHEEELHRRSWDEARVRRGLRGVRWTAEVAR